MIEDILFIILWTILPFAWLYMLKISGLNLFKITIPSIIISAILIYQYIGLPVLYFMFDDYRAIFVTDKWLVMQVFIYTSVTITLMLAGFVFARQYFGVLQWDISARNQYANTTKPILKWHFSRLNIGVLFFALISFIVLAMYLSQLDNIALFSVLTSDKEISFDAARSSMGNSFDGKYHWYKVFMNDILVFLVFTTFAGVLLKKTFTNKILFTILFLVASFVMVMSLEKAPIAVLIIGIFLIYLVVKKKRNIPIKSTIYLVVSLLTLLSIFYIYFMNSSDVFSAILSIFSRMFTGQIQPAYHYLEYFKEHALLMGTSFPNPRGIFPFENFILEVEIMNWVHPELAEQDAIGSMPTIFWGAMYANFGIIGVLIPPFFVGFGLYWLNVIMFKFSYSPLTIGIFVWLILHLKNLGGTSLVSYMLDIYMILVCVVFIVLLFFTGKGKIIYRSNSTKTTI